MIAKTIISTVLGLLRSGEASLIRWHLNRDHTHTYVYMYICVCVTYIYIIIVFKNEVLLVSTYVHI